MKKIFVFVLLGSLLITCKKDETVAENPLAFEANSNVLQAVGDIEIISADMNKDGKPDFIGASLNSRLPVWINTSSPGSIGSFVNFRIPSESSYLVKAADFDGDGRMDVVAMLRETGQHPKQIVIFRQKDNGGSFSAASFEVPIMISPNLASINFNSLEVTDFDHDGKTDIAFVDADTENQNYIVILRNKHDGGALTSSSFDSPVKISVGFLPSFVAGDMNIDSKPEMVVYYYANDGINTTAGDKRTFILVNNNSPGSIDAASFIKVYLDLNYKMQIQDMDGDNRVDLMLLSRNSVAFIKNSGDGSSIAASDFRGYFSPYIPFQFTTMSNAVLKDINGDNSAELILGLGVGDNKGAIYIRKYNFTASDFSGSNDTNLSFFSTPTIPTEIFAEDIDGDGKKDICMMSGMKLTVYRNLRF